MTVYELTTAILIGLGACALLFSLHGTMKILGILKFNRYRTSWLVLAVLSAFFLVGYLAVIHFIVAGHFEYLKLFAGLIFFFGAIYVFIVVRTGHLTIKDLTNTKSFADNVVNSMSGCLFLMNPRLEVVKINRATLDLTGYAEGEILGKSINDFIVASGVEDGQYLKCTV
jgi:PAS domain-containing protein